MTAFVLKHTVKVMEVCILSLLLSQQVIKWLFDLERGNSKFYNADLVICKILTS